MPIAWDTAPKVLVDYRSPDGPTVTHMRGLLFVDALENLRTWDLYARYEQHIAREHRDAIAQALASSWVPMEHAIAHYAACDALQLNGSQLQAMAGQITQRIASTLFASVVRKIRGAGVESFKLALGNTDRLHQRLYRGGAVRVIMTGRKDAVVETYGFPIAQSRSFRGGVAAFGEFSAAMFCKAAVVRHTVPSEPNASSLALAYSWV